VKEVPSSLGVLGEDDRVCGGNQGMAEALRVPRASA
jgi:hypothetical protein